MLLKQGLFTIYEVTEQEKAEEERNRLLETSLQKLQIFKDKSKKFSALLKPFRRIGFREIRKQGELMKFKDGLEELDYLLSRALRRKALVKISEFDNIAYLRRKMQEQDFEAYSHKKKEQRMEHSQGSIPRVTVFTQSRAPEQSASPSRVRVQRISVAQREDEMLRRSPVQAFSHHTIV